MALKNDFGNVQDLVAIKDIRQSTVILTGGAMRQIIMVGGLNFSLKSEEEQNIITQAYQNFLNSVNFPIQIIVHSRKINIEHYLANLEKFKLGETVGLLQDQISEYQEFVRGFIKDNPIMAKTFFVVVPYVPVSLPTVQSSSSFLSSLPFLGQKKGGAQEAAAEKTQTEEAAFGEALQQLKQRVSEVVQGLSSVGLEAILLNDEQLVELYYNFYNPETTERQKIAEQK
jgi:type IV secretory pathway VirB4 component